MVCWVFSQGPRFGGFGKGVFAEICAFCGCRCLSATCTAGSILDVFRFLGHDPASVQSSEFLPPFTAQPHCIAAISKSCVTVVMHCISCSHCISNRFCCCGKPSIGLTLEQQPHLSPAALQLNCAPQVPLRSATTPMQCTLHFEKIFELFRVWRIWVSLTGALNRNLCNLSFETFQVTFWILQ